MTTLTELKTNLNVAARTMQGYGATQSQIDYIVSLVEQSGEEPSLYEVNRFTSAQASRVIDNLINPIDFSCAISSEDAAKAAKEIEDHNTAYGALEELKAAWIATNYPDYADRSKKTRKNIRSKANKAIAA